MRVLVTLISRSATIQCVARHVDASELISSTVTEMSLMLPKGDSTFLGCRHSIFLSSMVAI